MPNKQETPSREERHGQRFKFFKAQEAIMLKIRGLGFGRYVETLAKIADAFYLRDRCIRCIDEGTPGGIHSAGSGILRNKSEVVTAFRVAKASKITSHSGCGAAKLYAKTHGLEVKNADDYGKAWAQDIAQKLNLPYEHIDFPAMRRPKDFHIARVAYYDGTGKFDFSNITGLPPGFIISRKIQSEADSLAEIQATSEIALGGHGFGELISKETPFIIAAIAESKEELAALQAELAKTRLLGDDRFFIDGFIAPSNR